MIKVLVLVSGNILAAQWDRVAQIGQKFSAGVFSTPSPGDFTSQCSQCQNWPTPWFS